MYLNPEEYPKEELEIVHETVHETMTLAVKGGDGQ